MLNVLLSIILTKYPCGLMKLGSSFLVFRANPAVAHQLVLSVVYIILSCGESSKFLSTEFDISFNSILFPSKSISFSIILNIILHICFLASSN